jgi:hypothetical protein
LAKLLQPTQKAWHHSSNLLAQMGSLASYNSDSPRSSSHLSTQKERIIAAHYYIDIGKPRRVIRS